MKEDMIKQRIILTFLLLLLFWLYFVLNVVTIGVNG